MKTNAIVRIVLFSLTIVVLIGLLLSAMGLVINRRNTNEIFTSEAIGTDIQGPTVELDASGIRKLNIEWAAGDIIIEAKEGIDQIQFSESAAEDSKYPMHYKTSGSKLTISFSKDSITGFGININSSLTKDLTVYVPQDWVCEELQLEVAAANVDVRNMTIDAINFDGASGTCNFVSCIVNDLDIDTASGDVTFVGELNSLDFDAASASFSGVLSNSPREIEMDGMSGDLDLTLPQDCGFTVSMDGMSSDFHSDYPTTYSNGNQVYGDGRCRISVDGMSCDVYIRQAS